MKKIVVSTVLAIAFLFVAKSYYDGACMDRQYDYARITVKGVYCYTAKSISKPYKPLRDIDIFRPSIPFYEKIL